MKKKLLTTIEITDFHIKFTQSMPLRTKRVVNCCEVVPIDGFSDEEVLRELQKITSTKTISPDGLTVIIPRRFAILKQISLPSHNDEEIKKMLGLQLVGQIPYSLEDVVYDYQLIGKDSSGYSRVLVMVVHKEVSERYIKGFHKIGIGVTKLQLSSFGVLQWWAYQEVVNKTKKSEAVVIVNVDVVHSEICFCHDGKLLFSRSINFGSRDLNADGVGKMVNQLDLSIKAYEKENMGPILEKIVIVSSMPEAVNLKEELSKENRLTIEILTSYENIFAQKKVNLSSLKNQRGLSLTVGFGFHFLLIGKGFNLAPQEVHDTKRMELKKRHLAKLVFFMVLAFGLFCSDYLIELVQKSSELKTLENRIEDMSLQTKKANERIQFVESFGREVNSWVFFPDLIYELHKLVIEGVSFHSLNLNDEGQLVIQGYALTSSNVNKFQSNLLKSHVFEEVNLQFATKRKIFNHDITDFKIVCQLKQKDVFNND